MGRKGDGLGEWARPNSDAGRNVIGKGRFCRLGKRKAVSVGKTVVVASLK